MIIFQRKRTWTYPLLIAGALLTWLLSPLPARADVGLIWTAQGGDIAPGEEPTQVQMVSEAVTLTLASPEDGAQVAHVDAVFRMQNQGGDTETHEVWFPLTTGAGYGAPFPPDAPSQAENFQAWVNGEPVTVTEAPGRDLLGFRDEVPWVTWSVDFPPGQTILLRVTYDVHPVDWGGWAVTHYILETGADWHGPISEGTITFRLPYEVTPMNVQLAEIREAYTGPDRPFEITVDGSDVTWRFTDLDPTPFPAGRARATRPFPESDNLILPLMPPSEWTEIEAARADAEANPDSVEAHLRLAEALEAGTQRIKVFSATEANTLLIERTDAAYQRALELAPQDVDTRIAYLKWLAVPRYDEEGDLTLGEGLDTLLSETQELAPNDQRIRRVEVSVSQWREDLAASRSDAPTTMPIGMPESGSPLFDSLYPGAVIVGGLILIQLGLRNRKAKFTRTSPFLIACVLLIGLLGLAPPPASADVAPPWTAQGGAVMPGEEPTQVAMISETVTLIVEPLAPADPDTARADERMVAHVEATFLMRNQGTEAEALDVWFPTTSRDDYGWDFSYPDPIETFLAWVNGEPAAVAEATGQDDHGTTWATWPVTFPPGEDVRLRVTYDTHPIGWGPWGSLPYILETGAGWRGPIGEGTITFRLPYEVTPMNVQLAEIREAYTGADRPFEIAVDGTDVSWHFTDLEPERSEHPWSRTGRETDNPTLTLLAPAVWAEIQAAQAHAEAHPDSVEAHLRLAEALERGTYRKSVIFYREANTLLIERTEVAYRRALELAPDDIDVLVAYLEWLVIQREQPWGGATLGEGLDNALSQALELDPDHPRVLEIEEWVEHWRREVAPHMPQPPTPTVPASPTPTASPEPTATPQPSRTPTQTPTPMETSTPTATATPTPPPTTRQTTGTTTTGGILLGIVVLVGLLTALWLTRKS